jgi:hypothetical protein
MPSMRVVGLLFAVLACACSSSSNVPDGGLDGGTDATPDAPQSGGPDYVSGTRLRAEVYTSADGAKQWHGWYDSQLKTECRVEAAEDGQLRCVPVGLTYDEGYFADNNCQQPVAVAGSCDAAPTYVVRFPTSGCNNTVYALGTKVGTLATIWTNTQGGCQSATADASATYYLVGAKMDPTAFVKETRTREPRGPELQMQFLAGDDGSKQPNGLYDSKLGGSCSTLDAPAMPYTDRCVPSHVGYAEGDYSDGNCKQPAITVVPDQGCYYPSDDVQSIAWVYDLVTCKGAQLTRFFEIGAPSTGPLNRLSGTVCANDPSAPSSWWTTGAEVAATSFPAITYTQSGQGRVVQSWQTAASSDKLFVDRFYDTQLKVACDQKPASDGKLRCIPHVDEIVPWYADDKCTNAVFAVSAPTSCTNPPPPAALRAQIPIANGCGTRYSYYQVGAKMATPAQLWQLNGTCQTGFVDPAADYYPLSEVDPATLAELTDVTE